MLAYLLTYLKVILISHFIHSAFRSTTDEKDVWELLPENLVLLYHTHNFQEKNCSL